ncbi:MAG: phosphoribosylamine--glycine ligase [Planctomycetes bacterium]|nr:phosphoribosylamine--glycine ligase [Planctomycetota bacterium]
MKILVVGGGGREHALCWKLAQSARKPQLFCAPGNGGTATLATNVPIAAEDISALLAFAKSESINLTVVGPEAPLCAGIVDLFAEAGLRIFGPTKAAAKIEGDKAHAKRLMREAGIPTAEARIFEPTVQEVAFEKYSKKGDGPRPKIETAYDMAYRYVVTREEGVVVKASGLAAGKGVFVHEEPGDALLTLERLMVKRELGEAGAKVVIEEILLGPEVSVLALVDGRNIYILESAADHKRLGEQDTGPNTGGMGAFSPSGLLTESDLEIIERDVFVPIIDAMRREDVIFKGVLYAGMIMTAAGPKVLEFNCRLGDPETQPLLMRLKSDLVDLIEATIDGRLDEVSLEWDRRASLCVVMASGGYPGPYEKNVPIEGLAAAGELVDVQVFHAGTAVGPGNEIVTSGGRVLGVTALGDDVHLARGRAYEAVRAISFKGAQVRGDIGMRVSNR